MIVKLIQFLSRRLQSFLERLQAGRPNSRRRPKSSPRVLAFFSSAPALSQCPTCGHVRRSTSPPPSERAARTPPSSFDLGVSLLIVGLLGGLLGWMARGVVTPPRVVRNPNKSPAMPLSVTGPSIQPGGVARKETGPLWTIYTSLDRLTDRPLLGVSVGKPGGPEFFAVLCREGQSVLALDRLISADEGGKGSARRFAEAAELARRVSAHRQSGMEIRFDDGPVERMDAMPARPLEFLTRVAASRRIRTASSDFDTQALGEVLKRIQQGCVFRDQGPAPRTGEPGREP